MPRVLSLVVILAAGSSIVNAQVISNGSFEHAKVNDNSWVGGGEADGWTFNASSGIARGDGAWGRGGHSGDQYAYLQSRGDGIGLMTQVVKGLTRGQKYRVFFWMARRNTTYAPIRSANVAIPVSLLADNTTIFDFASPTGVGEWRLYESKPFIATTPGLTLTFMAQTSSNCQDRASLIDDVVLSPVVRKHARVGAKSRSAAG